MPLDYNRHGPAVTVGPRHPPLKAMRMHHGVPVVAGDVVPTPDKAWQPLYGAAFPCPEFVSLVALSPPVASSLRQTRWAVGAFFFVFGVFIATWVPHIPLAKDRLDVSPAWFGAALLCMGGGGVLGMVPVGVLINRWGSARVLTWTASLAGACPPFLALAPSYWAFVAALSTFGALAGMTDVAMNAHGMEVEKRMGRAVLSGFHGLFSVAGPLSTGGGSLLIQPLTEPRRVSPFTLV